MDNKASIPADILWINEVTCAPNYLVKAHAHITYYHLLYILKGRCKVTINKQTYELVPDMFMIAMPEDVHSIHKIVEDEEVRIGEIKFIVYSPSLNDAFKKLDRVFVADNVTSRLVSDILDGVRTNHYINITAIRAYLLTILYRLCGDTINTPKDSLESSCLRGIDTSGFSRATIETVRYIENNYMHEISLDRIGKEIGYYKGYISTVVKKDLSITVNELLSFVRIRKAAELLYYSDDTIQQIYMQTGFKSAVHFTQLFKKMIGIPPAQYRKSFPEETALDAEGIPISDVSTPVWLSGLLRDYIESKMK